MSTVRGFGRYLGALGSSFNLTPLADVWPADKSAPVVADWFFPPGPDYPLQLPYSWISPPLRSRPDKPFTSAHVSQSGGTSVTQSDSASTTEYGDSAFEATLSTVNPNDPGNLVAWILAYYATQPGSVPRARFPALLINLSGRPPGDQMRILSARIGQRIHITGAPATWPQGATEQVIEGIHHILGDSRAVEWTTSPVVGSSPGVAGPWFRLDVSALGGTDSIPF